jgi:ectoine hydroxylase-related dioxygenase (phytanoyl-CoA dioxygenase family)
LQGEPFRALVAAVLGPEADLRFTTSLTKTAELPAHMDWHQDDGYARDPEHDKFSFWIAVTASRLEDGCLRIIQGSQNRGLLPHVQSPGYPREKTAEGVDESLAEDVEMEPGDILMLHRHVLHASWPNRSGRPRMAMLAGFMPPKREYLDFEKLGAFRYFRGGFPVWERISDPDHRS